MKEKIPDFNNLSSHSPKPRYLIEFKSSKGISRYDFDPTGGRKPVWRGANVLQAALITFSLGLLTTAFVTIAGSPQTLASDPLYEGTVYISPHVLTPSSPSGLMSVAYNGLSNQRTFDRRVNAWVSRNSHVFEARFECGRETVLVVVNSEFGRDEAEIQARRFARVLGQLPIGSRHAVHEIWIHDGNESAGGGNNSILIHTGYADSQQPFLEEIFLHEAAHTSLDWAWGGVVSRDQWNVAANSDRRYISQYASAYPEREDVAESYGAFVLFEIAKTNSVLQVEAERIGAAIPNRLNYFRSLGPEFSPSQSVCSKTVPSQDPEQPKVTPPQGRKLILAGRGNGVRLLGASLSDNGINLKAKLGTKLKRGSRIQVIVGKGDQRKMFPQRVGVGGRIELQTEVRSVSDVAVRDSDGRLIVRWRIF